MRKPRVLVTSGDPGGVGPELILRALTDPEIGGLAEFTVLGNPADFRRDAAALGVPLPRIRPAGDQAAVPVGRPSAEGARAAVAAARAAARLMAADEADALVTAPVSKEALRLGGYPWPGQTEMLADLCAARDLRVLLMAGPLRVVHVSAHRSLSADTLFPRARAGQADLVVAMYHDQGHIPVKLLSPDDGVAVTLGLPFLRAAPDHGAAFDIAGKQVASAASMKAALRAASELAGHGPAGGGGALII